MLVRVDVNDNNETTGLFAITLVNHPIRIAYAEK